MAGLTDKPPSIAQSQTRESWSTAYRHSLVLLTEPPPCTQQHLDKFLQKDDWEENAFFHGGYISVVLDVKGNTQKASV